MVTHQTINRATQRSRRTRAVFQRSVVFLWLFSIFTQAGTASSVQAADVHNQLHQVQISTGPLVKPVSFDGDLRHLPHLQSYAQNRSIIHPLISSTLELPELASPTPGPSLPALQLTPTAKMPAPSISFDGLNFANWGAGYPPDPVGDVGPNNYIQAVNTSIAIYNKSGNQLAAFTFNQFWRGANTGTPCDNSHNGDPTVVYDPMADRWFIADFAFVSVSTPPYYECIAVSKTGDPLNGGWRFYPIRTDDFNHPFFSDYPKMGIWPDGLYLTGNLIDPTSGAFQEVRVWVFNRTDMESGAPVRSQVVDLGTPNYFGFLPSNLRGAQPPAGRENLLVSLSLTTSALQVWKFHVDYSGSATSFSGPFNEEPQLRQSV